MLISDIIIEKKTDKNVTISIKSWNKIKNEILKNNKNLTKNELIKFNGIIKLTKKPLQYQNSIRNEW